MSRAHTAFSGGEPAYGGGHVGRRGDDEAVNDASPIRSAEDSLRVGLQALHLGLGPVGLADRSRLPVPTRTKRSIERHGWITVERSSVGDDGMLDWLRTTDEGRRAYIAAGGNPGAAGSRKAKRRAARR